MPPLSFPGDSSKSGQLNGGEIMIVIQTEAMPEPHNDEQLLYNLVFPLLSDVPLDLCLGVDAPRATPRPICPSGNARARRALCHPPTAYVRYLRLLRARPGLDPRLRPTKGRHEQPGRL